MTHKGHSLEQLMAEPWLFAWELETVQLARIGENEFPSSKGRMIRVSPDARVRDSMNAFFVFMGTSIKRGKGKFWLDTRPLIRAFNSYTPRERQAILLATCRFL